MIREVIFVPKDEQWDASETGLREQLVKLKANCVERVLVCRIYDEYDCVDTVTIPLPHGTEFRLTGDVPNLERHRALANFAIIEGDGRYDVLCPLSGS